jgi:hypothetical protein
MSCPWPEAEGTGTKIGDILLPDVGRRVRLLVSMMALNAQTEPVSRWQSGEWSDLALDLFHMEGYG